ncbi:spore coat protein [Lachnospiraceae bacterium MD1]|jgi:similar to spore coat protein|uniref:Spore coat protein n=1 Tax=Variimorphobacter saccharofermentans TaxID=2755051 RepID=A0A839K2J8_9FIRM|nr:spore coat protein [Variimorphobacter saccharofermentans]MBB2183618.1 spore coat protein [Variimorphobacter saccharofermentans]
MRIGNSIAPHEALELHELLTFKNVCATKSASMAALVKDDELKTILEQDFNTSKEHIKELQDLMVGASTAFDSASKATVG